MTKVWGQMLPTLHPLKGKTVAYMPYSKPPVHSHRGKTSATWQNVTGQASCPCSQAEQSIGLRSQWRSSWSSGGMSKLRELKLRQCQHATEGLRSDLLGKREQSGRTDSVPSRRAVTTMAVVETRKAAPFVGDLGVRSGFIEAVGNTPLIRLNKASEETGCEIYGKAEFLNPGGSVKDRAALYIIKDAEERGLLQEGGVIVEGTAGNTGIGLALVGNAKGYRTVIVIPETQSQEKKDMLRIAGATLIQVPAVPYKNPNNYVKYSGRLAEQIAKTNPGGAIWGNQFDNPANRRAHYETTGPEIWAQTGGKVDGFICAIGTGGTLAGTGKYLKEKNPNVRIGMVDPMGAALFSYFKDGVLQSSGNSISEGIGQGRITGNLDSWAVPAREGGVVDFWCQATDEEALPIMYSLLKQEGLCMGSSTGINVAGAIKLAKELGPGHTIVTILCDLGTRYQGKIFNVDFLKSKGLPFPEWLEPSYTELDVPNVFEPVA